MSLPSLIRLGLDVALLVAACTAAAFYLWAAFAPRRQVVLGAQLAAARTAEEARIAAGGYDPSPLKGKAYRPERGDFSLMKLVPSDLDREISELAVTWRASDSVQRERIRRSLTMDDNYTLIQFAKRMAVRALNASPEAHCDDGLSALAMIDESRIDPRDASLPAGLLSHAAVRANSAVLFDRAIAFATPGMGERIRRPMKWTLKDCGYREWRSAGEIGLVCSGTAPYQPSIDLAAAAQRIGVQVLDGRYRVDDVEVATTLPPVWFARARRDHAAAILARSQGAAFLRAYSRPAALS